MDIASKSDPMIVCYGTNKLSQFS